MGNRGNYLWARYFAPEHPNVQFLSYKSEPRWISHWLWSLYPYIAMEGLHDVWRISLTSADGRCDDVLLTYIPWDRWKAALHWCYHRSNTGTNIEETQIKYIYNKRVSYTTSNETDTCHKRQMADLCRIICNRPPPPPNVKPIPLWFDVTFKSPFFHVFLPFRLHYINICELIYNLRFIRTLI